MFSLFLHDDAQNDLNYLEKSGNPDDRDAAALIIVFLEEAKNNQRLLDSLSAHNYQDGVMNVSRFEEQWRKGRNLWRLKLVDLAEYGLNYRIIYAFDPKEHRYYILGIVHRNFNYDECDPRTQRIVAAYENLYIE